MITGTPFFDDTGFFGSNLCQRIAQKLYVVEADVGDDAQVGLDDVGTVQSSSKAHLNDGHIHLLLGEISKSHGSGQLKERRV